MSVGNLPYLIVSGPTASGKSCLALELALRLKGEIVNIDSVQIYKGLEVGSAKASMEERRLVPHHLLDMVEPSVQSSVSDYLGWVDLRLEELDTRGVRAVFVGGSTMYITCLLHGIAPLPKRDPELRAELEKMSGPELKQMLLQIDPKSAARLHENDRVRLIRAIESSKSSPMKASEALELHGFSERKRAALIIVPVWEREVLYQRIDARTKRMLDNGLVDETRALIQEFGTTAPALRSLGYAQTVEYLSQKISSEKLLADISQFTRNFAKRQMTFWRNEPLKRGWQTQPGSASEAQVAERGQKRFETLNLNLSGLCGAVEAFISCPQERTEVWYVDARTIIEELERNSEKRV